MGAERAVYRWQPFKGSQQKFRRHPLGQIRDTIITLKNILFIMSKRFTNLRFPGFLVGLLLLGHMAYSQVPNFSMYHYTPFFTNPGEIGAVEDVRIMANYRNQQVDLDENFTSSTFSAYFPMYVGKNRLVFAGSFLNDKSSDLLTTNGGMFALAYSIRTKKHAALSLGIQAGYFQGKIGGSYITDDQYVDGTYDPDIVSGDAVLQNTKGYPAFSGGLYYKVKDKANREKAFIGASIFNINQPDISLIGTRKDPLPMSVKASAGYRIYKGEKFSIMPTGRMVSQAGNTFFNLGSRFGYEVGNQGNGEKKIELGLWYHTNSYGIFSLAYQQENMTIAASFDKPVNMELGKAQNGIVELAISFRLKKKKRNLRSGYTSTEQPDTELKEEEPAKPNTEETEPENNKGGEEEATVPNTEKSDSTETEEVIETLPEEEAVQDTAQVYPGNHQPENLTTEEKALFAQTVKFDFNSDNLDQESKAFLEEVAIVLRNKEHFTIELVGHSCNLGPESVNQELSVKRAGIVKQYLVNRGVKADRITVKGMGESEPLEDNTTQKGREHNRRVEFKIIYEN
ncbi:PorP/SprF family type IX secretion system membrane protein [Rapidithrix thailandica]|uniref:PorP/SprF family type IX secretion system membrane protein n=1 Tax=Rapidithrix thailandica TaxID=413964 RepID=A0AAW9S5N0_9BACT